MKNMTLVEEIIRYCLSEMTIEKYDSAKIGKYLMFLIKVLDGYPGYGSI